ncbi:restriction endonuclease [Methylobacterium sp. JK268]
MAIVTIVLIAAAPMVWIVVTGIQLHLMRVCRLQLRPHAESYVIEKRWLERWSRSGHDFETRWRGWLAQAYARHVRPAHRPLITRAGFERALNAEFAGLLNREIASWTFIDALSDTPALYERLVGACLDRQGWRATPLPFEDRQGADMVLTDGHNRVAVLLHYAGDEAACRLVQEVRSAARRETCNVACIISNGRINGAARALAERLDVLLLHCSQLDQLAEAARPAAAPAPRLRLAA